MKCVLISRVIKPGRVLAVSDADQPPTAGPLAVAVRERGGWRVVTGTGRLVAERLDKRKAEALMVRTATVAANSAAVRLLLDKAVTR